MREPDDDVMQFPGLTTAPEPAEGVLEKAKSWGLDVCVIVGEDEDGMLMIGGNTSDIETVVVLLERAKAWVMKETFDD